jgi:hypothetical protein
LRHEIKSFVEIFGAVLPTADDADALHDEISEDYTQRAVVSTRS